MTVNKKRVYLAGPITGTKEEDGVNWREYVEKHLSPDFQILSPTRGIMSSTNYSKVEELTPEQQLERIKFGKITLDRDRYDVMTSDFVLVNLSNATSVSIGTVGEIFWADAYRKPVFLVREKAKNLHDHALLNAIATQVCTTLDEAIQSIKIFAAV